MNEQRTKVFLDRYAARDASGEPFEFNPEQMWQRVAHEISDTEEQQDAFYYLMEDFKFVPGGRILAGAGIDAQVTYYNCYVIPVETRARRFNRDNERLPEMLQGNYQADPGCDSREAIFDTIGLMVDIMSRGGGVGINWSVLRPKGTYLKRVNGTTSGPVSWMDVASRAVGVVEQGGSRRGAAMFMLDAWHPDLMEFIKAKEDFSLITNANVSVSIPDLFMDCVREDRMWVFGFPDTSYPSYDTEWDGDLLAWAAKGYPVIEHGEMPAREIWRALAESAWKSGEPGVVFLDRYNKQSTGAGVERIISVNPCGEQGLGAYSVCNLGAMNLAKYVKPVYKYKKNTGSHEFDWTTFTDDVETAIEFLDNAIDKNYYFIRENEVAQKDLRRVGLGVMGLADALIALELRYGSNQAVEFTEKVFKTMKKAAIRRSCVLAQQKGKAPAWDLKETWRRPYFADVIDSPLGTQVQKYGLRNMFLLTQAPTGTTSILAGVNSGIEPLFALGYWRYDRTGDHYIQPACLEGLNTGNEVDGDIYPAYVVTANDVTVEEHLTMQAAAQAFIDSSVSKTINGPNSHTVEDVEKAYSLAYDKGLKGLAYYRDGSRDKQVLNHEKKDDQRVAFLENELAYAQAQNGWMADEIDSMQALIPYVTEFVRPEVLDGSTTKTTTRAGTAYITVNRDSESGRAVEVFFNVGKAGSDVASMAEALGRLASLALRHGASIGGVANQLEGVGGQAQFNKPIPHAIGEALTNANRPQVRKKPGATLQVSNELGTWEMDATNIRYEPAYVPPKAQKADLCPECGTASFIREEGCAKCLTCGHSQC